MEAGAVEAVAALRAAFDAFTACDFGSLTRAELVAVLDEYEALQCQLPAPLHRMLAQLQADTTPGEMGAKSWNAVLRIRWRLSTAEAGRRLGEAAALGPRRTLTGEPLPPLHAAVAAAQRAGLINADHVKVLRDAIDRLPGFVDTTTGEQFEADLVRVALGVGPKELKETAELRLFLLDQDGPEPDDTERARKRAVAVGKQGRDGMSALTANLNPEAAAVWEVLFAKFAAPGMCNPDDDQPCTSGTPTQAQIDADHRTLAQRLHDALLVVGRIALMSGDLGQLNGLPVSIIIRTTLQDLESRAGIGVTGGGLKLPITDVVRMASHANHHLVVFDRATGAALDYFRARRTASPAQRIVLIARDGGCTKPCCSVGAYGSQAHHAVTDWAQGGNTNVDEMALACGPDNRLVHADGGYTTTINAHGQVEWHPPPGLDHGQQRINYFHRPELLLAPPEDQPHHEPPSPQPQPEPELVPEQEYDPEPIPQQDLTPTLESELDWNNQQDPEWDLKRDVEWDNEQDLQWDLEWDPQWDRQWNNQQDPEMDPKPDVDWDDQQDLQWDLEWDPQWVTDFDQTTPSPPNVEHLWDPQPCNPEPVDPRLPPSSVLLDDTPGPWQPTGNDCAAGAKDVRGP